MTLVVCLLSLIVLTASVHGQDVIAVKGRNLSLHGEKVFLSGMNQAWYSYGNDFGNGAYSASRPHLLATLDAIHSSGGNSIRLWVHINGLHTPTFNTSGYVTGLDPFILRDLEDFLQQAQARNILVNLALWNCAVLSTDLPMYGLLTNASKLQSYINNALTPMVRFLKSQRALGIWEIINEPEGCVKPEVKSEEACYDTSSLHWSDFSDWTERQIPLSDLLRFIARQAAAIHAEDSQALVTVGAWTYKSVTNQLDRRNFYSDECLQKASGGLSGARLDVYQIHTYDTLFFYLPHDPFKVDASIYGLDKPVIIGEFSQKKGGLMTSPEQYTWAYNHGYSGAWAWCALSGDAASDSVAVMEGGIGALRNRNDQSKGGRVNITLQYDTRAVSPQSCVTRILLFLSELFTVGYGVLINLFTVF